MIATKAAKNGHAVVQPSEHPAVARAKGRLEFAQGELSKLYTAFDRLSPPEESPDDAAKRLLDGAIAADTQLSNVAELKQLETKISQWERAAAMARQEQFDACQVANCEYVQSLRPQYEEIVQRMAALAMLMDAVRAERKFREGLIDRGMPFTRYMTAMALLRVDYTETPMPHGICMWLDDARRAGYVNSELEDRIAGRA